MFYSQFILAKKGPLGTIWIAAHLERKLRKNQVADTDIGVSVDSILFPEVPIALRLSSHLLLGVVRIYSRKVNYLFHDCSEALLKIKQAFRSTAVDLPPEESTAPYHSITLPETFDLDDFELPDNAFHGNYVDHHVSTREQITLQDTMDGMVYSTSQFGLDERFGDGDASQIGLDLDEVLFLEKVSSGHGSAPLGLDEDMDPQPSAQPVVLTEMEIDGAETSRAPSEFLAGNQRDHIDSNILDSKRVDDSAHQQDDQIHTPDLNEELLPCEPIEGPSDAGATDFAHNPDDVPTPDLAEFAQAPSTPGLMAETIPALSLLKKTSARSDVEGLLPGVINSPHLESVAIDSTKPVSELNLENPLNEPNYHITDAKHALDCASLSEKISDTDDHFVQNLENGNLQNMPIKHPTDQPSFPVGPISSDMVQSVTSPTSVLTEPKPICQVPESSGSHLVSSNELSLKCGQEMEETVQNKSQCSEVSDNPYIDKSNNGEEAMEPQADPSCLVASSPGCSHETSNLQASYDRHLDGVEAIPMNHDSTTDCQASSSGVPTIEEVENVQCGKIYDPEAIANLGPVHVLQACSSTMNQHNTGTLGNRVLYEDAADLSEVGLCTIGQEIEAPHVDVPSAEIQGVGSSSTNFTDANLVVQQMPPESSKSDECLEREILKDNQLGGVNCSASSEFPAPETLLSAPTEISDLPNYLVQSTADKAVTGEGTVDKFGSLSGRKRRLLESTPVLENGSLSRYAGVLRSKRSTEYVPDDNDILASILVGKRTPVLKMRSTPTPTEVVSSKRPRMTPRVMKRKVLLDDTMVLHGDVIRKQLTNTEDIRRIRRKVPCTRKEFWIIQKYLSEEEIFSEPLFTDISTTLTGLQNQTFYLTEIGVSPTDAQLSSIEAIEEPELSRRLERNKQTGLEEIDRAITDLPDKSDGTVTEPTEIVVIQAENQPSDYAISIGADNKVLAEGSMEVEVHDKGVSNVVNHTDAIGSEMAMMSASLPGDDYSASVDFRNESSLMGEYDVMLTAPQKNDGLCFSPDHKSVIDPTADGPREMNGEALHLIDDSFNEKDITITDNADRAVETIDANHETVILGNGTSVEKDETMLEEAKDGISVGLVPPCLPHDSHDVLGEVANEETLVLLPDNCSVEAAANVLADSLSPNTTLHISDVVLESDGLSDMVVVTNNMGTSEIRDMELEVVVDDIVAEKVTNDEGEPLSSGPFMEEPQIAPSCPLQPHPEIENAPLNVEGPGFEDGNQQSALDMEMPVTVGSPVGDSTDFGYILDDNDTEFLNVDDEAEPVEEDDNNVPAAEENRFIDNSGWSSRTRSVARYLRCLFDNEAGRGMKNLPVDNLLAGKTRKEASRMFFETLVLKTRDYIHVEQENPFDKINIQPRVKLLKSEF